MADKKNPGIEAALARMKEQVHQEVEQHKDEDFNLDELEDVSGGWKIYSTDPADTDPVGGLNPNQT